MVRVAGLEPACLSTTVSETVASACSAIPAVCLLAVRVGFEPTVHGVHSGFRDRRLNPLGHLTVLCGTQVQLASLPTPLDYRICSVGDLVKNHPMTLRLPCTRPRALRRLFMVCRKSLLGKVDVLLGGMVYGFPSVGRLHDAGVA